MRPLHLTLPAQWAGHVLGVGLIIRIKPASSGSVPCRVHALVLCFFLYYFISTLLMNTKVLYAHLYPLRYSLSFVPQRNSMAGTCIPAAKGNSIGLGLAPQLPITLFIYSSIIYNGQKGVYHNFENVCNTQEDTSKSQARVFMMEQLFL